MISDPWPPDDFYFDFEDMPDPDPFADTAAEDPEIREALDAAGYYHEPATDNALRECFLDYVDAGIWRDLDLNDAYEAIQRGDITKKMMIYALRRG